MEFAAYQAPLVTITLLGSLVGLIWGISTAGKAFPNAKLDREFGLSTATPARRLGGNLLDGLVMVLTLFIGWLVWFIIVAPRGQTPGKALIGTYVIRDDGTRAGGWFMWGREALMKWFLLSLVDLFAAGLLRLIASLWCLWDPDKQCGWDKLMNSYVAYSPAGDPARRAQAHATDAGPANRLRELQELREEGLITAEEYEQRRKRLVEQL